MSSITKPVILDETGQGIVTAINGVATALAPTGSIVITDSGTYDVTTKASAIVNVQKPLTASTIMSFDEVMINAAITASHTEVE